MFAPDNGLMLEETFEVSAEREILAWAEKKGITSYVWADLVLAYWNETHGLCEDAPAIIRLLID